MFENLKLIGKNIGTQGINTLLAFGFMIVAARLLSTSDYGELRYTMIMLPLFMAFTLPGYDSMILRDTSLGGSSPLWRIFRVRFAGGLAGSLLILVTIALLHPLLGNTLFFFLVATAILLPFFETGTGYRNYLVGRGLRHKSLNLVFQARFASLILFASMGGLILELGGAAVWLYPTYLSAMIVPTLAAFMLVILRCRGRRLALRHQKGGISIVPAITATAASVVYTFAYSLDKLWLRADLGAEALARYSILVMAPLELAKLLDATLPLYYLRLFFSQGASPYTSSHHRIPIFLATVAVGMLASYTVLFYFFSSSVFGAAYSYPLPLVFLSSLLMLGQSFEYFYNHKIFACIGSKGQLVYAVLNLAACTAVIPLGLSFGEELGLISALIAKQILILPLFHWLYWSR